MVGKMKKHIKESPVLSCQQCGAQMKRGRFPSGRLMDLGQFMKRKFCSTDCRNASLVKEELKSHQSRWRSRCQKKECCELCSSQKNLQVHHIDKDILNNSQTNLQTLCASCHNKLHWKERKVHGK